MAQSQLFGWRLFAGFFSFLARRALTPPMCRHPLWLRLFPCATHQTTTRNVIADAVVDLVDLGTTNANGKVLIYSANRQTQLAEVDLANPAFGDAVTGVALANSLPLSDSLADAGGTAALFDVVDRDENVIYTGTIGTSAEDDMVVIDTEIAKDDIVKIVQLSYTAPP